MLFSRQPGTPCHRATQNSLPRMEHGSNTDRKSVFHPCSIRGSMSSDFGLRPLILTLFSSPPNLKKPIGEWCNGSTADSGSACLGSNPSSPASIKPEMPVDTTISKMYWQQSGNSFPVTLGWRCHPKEGNQWRPSKNAAAHGASSSASVDCSIS